ncbi:SDR family NAD(P)-dependent oxidoreductase [Streptomyces sp. NPDC002722]|uniref:SDR family NAD(P)-dependent oxidoreductase n=1 Tax=unclassified Streptomyces TaxID=2593676 RepID=UPI00332FAF4D
MTTSVVGGGTRGIGQALSRWLAALYRGDDLAAQQAEKVSEGRIEILRCDLTRPDEIQAVCARTITEYGAPTVLVNNAETSTATARSCR